ncbi:MAG: hypothetical protein PHI43_05285 [Candidatus Hydrothermia bacterium]|nr:hypothetical protein [Candidatus Hydrothermia bacterium]
MLQYVLRKMVADANGVNILPFYGDSLEFRGDLCGAFWPDSKITTHIVRSGSAVYIYAN